MISPAAVMRTARPRQWTKNLLVVAAPLAAGKVEGTLAPTLAAFVAFSLASSSIYALNDVADRELDRLHPTKRSRPIASGELSVRGAVLMAAVLAPSGLALAWVTAWEFGVLVGSYLVLQLLYAFWLKHEPVIDLVIVAAGFLLRAVGGALASALPVSQWFLLVAGFGALYIVSGKRYSELHTLGSEAGTRRSLVRYSASYLRFVWSTAAAATLMAYSLWAFEMSASAGVPWHAISIAPFVVGLMRYAVDVDAGTAAEPEDIIWTDRMLQGIGLVWIALAALGTFGG